MAKLYQTGNGLDSCPRCGSKKNPLDTTCKKCGYELKDLNIFSFGTSNCSDQVRDILKSYRSNVHTLNKVVIGQRKDSLDRAHRDVKMGWSVKSDIFESVSLGSPDAAIELARIYAKGELDGKYAEHLGDILALLCTAAECGSSSAARALYSEGFAYKLDRASDWKNTTDGLRIVTAASEIGLTWGMYCLGRFNFFGQCGIQKNLETARKLIKTAADDDYNPLERANRHIALCFFDGVGGYEKDIDYALVYARSARTLKNTTLCEMLNRTDLCKGDKFVSKAKEDFDVSEQIDWLQLIRLIQNATEKYSKIKGIGWAYSTRDLGHDVNLSSCKSPHTVLCAYLMNRAQAKKWSDKYAKTRLGLVSDVYAGRGIVVTSGKIYSTGADDDYVRRIEIPISGLFSTRIPNLFSNRVYFDGLDYSRDELLDYLKFLRRYILWDRKGGVELIDGSVQKEIIAKNAEVPITTAWKGEVFKKEAPKAPSHTTVISSQKHQSSNSTQKKSSSSKAGGVSRSSRKRWLFILIGIFLGLFGLHFLYARRKGWFVFYWLLLLGNFVHVNVPTVANVVPALSKIPVFGLLAGLIFVGSVFFMNKDGDGNRM